MIFHLLWLKVCQSSSRKCTLNSVSRIVSRTASHQRRPPLPHSKLTARDRRKRFPQSTTENASQSLQQIFFSKNVFKAMEGSPLGCFSGQVQSFGTVHVISRFQAPRSRRTPVCISPSPLHGSGEICRYPPPTRGGTYTYLTWSRIFMLE